MGVPPRSLGMEQQAIGTSSHHGDNVPPLLQHSRFDDAYRRLTRADLVHRDDEMPGSLDLGELLLEDDLLELLAESNGSTLEQ